MIRGTLRYNRIDAETIRDVSEKSTKPATRNAWLGLQKMLGRMSYFLFFYFNHKNSRVGGLRQGRSG